MKNQIPAGRVFLDWLTADMSAKLEDLQAAQKEKKQYCWMSMPHTVRKTFSVLPPASL